MLRTIAKYKIKAFEGDFNVKIDIQTIIDELIPLYAQSDDDLPNQALWKHPDIKSIHIIQEQLINLLFPGRSIEEKQPLESFFEIQFNLQVASSLFLRRRGGSKSCKENFEALGEQIWDANQW